MKAQLVAKFIDDPSNPVTVLTQSKLMDELFNWRIKDLDRIIKVILWFV